MIIGLAIYEANFPQISKYRVYSDGSHKVDTSFYTGSGGVAYVYSKAYALLKPNDQGKDMKDRFDECFSVNLDLIESGKSKRAFECPSYY